jgi:Zn2+/Cd2+-exporting ATPase
MSLVRRQFRLNLSDTQVPPQFQERLRRRLMRHPGIANVDFTPNGAAPLLRLDYDPSQVTLAEIARELHQERADLQPTISSMIVPVHGMVSPRAERLVEQALGQLPGVVASASYAAQSLRLEFDRTQCPLPEIIRRLDRLGYTADFSKAHLERPLELPLPPRLEAPSAWQRLVAWLRDQPELMLAALAGALLLAGFLVHVLGGPQGLRISLLIGSYIVASRYTAPEAFHTLLQFRFNIDVLMFAAAFGAASLGHFEEGALLLFLFALGNAGEHLALSRARNAIEELSKLSPDTARLRRPDGAEEEVPVESVNVDDLVIVRPFNRIPLDGVVIDGTSAVDQSTITGESVPVEKSADSDVYAGTMNGEGRLVVRVSRSVHETTLAKIIRMVEEAQTTKSPTQRFADQIERYYVPLVLAATAVLIVLPPLLGFEPRRHGTLWGGWFYQSMAFLTAASPCALAIGTPSAILCGIARAARIGVLMKGGVFLESLGKVDVIAFDKTGTLTVGRPTVTDVVVLSDVGEIEALALAAAIEAQSTHPLAQAIAAEAQARGCPVYQPEEVEQVPGLGVIGRVNGRTVAAGQVGLVEWIRAGSGTAFQAVCVDSADQEGLDFEADQHGLKARATKGSLERLGEEVDRLAQQGRSTVVVWVDEVPAAIIALADQPRPEARQALADLKSLGIGHTIMLTGDHAAAAAAIAQQVGVDEQRAELLPDQKLKEVERLKQQYGSIVMVGDGVNDAPALATASIGVAMGAAGADVAMETADIVLMSSDLGRLPQAVALSRRARRIIAQNLLIALGVIVLMAPAAALGYATLGLAVLLHEGSTVVVVLNSLRLLSDRSGRVVHQPAQAHSDRRPLLQRVDG